MLGFEVRRALQGHRAAAPAVGGVDLGPGEAERRQQLEAGIIERARRDPQTVDAEIFPQIPFIKRELDVESRGERRLYGSESPVVEALFPEALVIDAGRAGERAVAERIALDVGDLGDTVAERL